MWWELENDIFKCQAEVVEINILNTSFKISECQTELVQGEFVFKDEFDKLTLTILKN